MGERPAGADDIEDVTALRAQAILDYAAGFAHHVARSRAARELRRLIEEHDALEQEQRPSAVDVYPVVMGIFDRFKERPRFEAGRRNRKSVALQWPTYEAHKLRERGSRLVREEQRKELVKLCEQAGIAPEPHLAELELAWSVELGMSDEERAKLLSEPMRWGDFSRLAPERLADELDRYAGAAAAAGAVERYRD